MKRLFPYIALLVACVGIQYRAGSVVMWHDIDGDCMADYVAAYVIEVDDQGIQRLVEVDRSYDPELVRKADN